MQVELDNSWLSGQVVQAESLSHVRQPSGHAVEGARDEQQVDLNDRARLTFALGRGAPSCVLSSWTGRDASAVGSQ